MIADQESLIMMNKSFRTSWLLWFLMALLVFVPLGFVYFPGTDDTRFWARLYTFCKGDYSIRSADYLQMLAVLAVVLLIPAILLGWVLQAVIVIARDQCRKRMQ
jgi:hypothetical protein